MAIIKTHIDLPYRFTRYEGKVRDVYNIEEAALALVATDRLSAFDCILPDAIPDKGQALSELSTFFFRKTREICPNHLLAAPLPNLTVGRKCEPYPIEVIVRGRLCGHAWRLYRDGARVVCGVELPDGLRENDALPEPILTPTTKSRIGHDTDVTEFEITKSGLIPGDEWMQIRYYALRLFAFGEEWARERGLLLADTKFEFGMQDFAIYVIDEIFTPDSSRYFYAEGFDERQANGQPQPQLSKEYVRQALLTQGFSGDEGQAPPRLSEAFIAETRRRYIEVFETLTGEKFIPYKWTDPDAELRDALTATMEALGFAPLPFSCPSS